MFGSPETTPGGKALKFYASVRLDIRRIDQIKVGTDAVGNRVKVKVVKNKVAPPFQVAEFDILFAQGISTEGCLLDVGLAHDLIKKSGAFWSYGDLRLGQGRENAREFLRADRAIRDQLEDQIRAAVAAPRTPLVLPVPGDLAEEPLSA
jgi:recombination protein RecA